MVNGLTLSLYRYPHRHFADRDRSDPQRRTCERKDVLRGVSEGTVKAQTNAIYRKAGVSGRTQLLALFIDQVVELPDAIGAKSTSDAPEAA